MRIKGTVSRDFLLQFFLPDSSPSGHIIHIFEYIYSLIRRDIHVFKNIIFVWPLKAFDVIFSQKQFYRGTLQYLNYKNKVLKSRLSTVSLNFWHRVVKYSKFRFEYLHEIKALFENTPACQSGAQVG